MNKEIREIEERANEWARVDELPVFECGECIAADLANQIPALLAEIKRLEAERDAAVEDIYILVNQHDKCYLCKHGDDMKKCEQRQCDLKEKCFEWRGRNKQ